jgi:predicted kinase
MLIILGGLPGSGKTTIAKALARRLAAPHIRIDSIEQALLRSGEAEKVETAGYAIAFAVAADCLRAGATVIADSVNPLAVTRDGWRAIAADAGVRALEVEILCSDPAEHRRRVETRTADIPGHIQPTWIEVVQRDYEPWTSADLVIDTASTDIDAAVADIVARLEG